MPRPLIWCAAVAAAVAAGCAPNAGGGARTADPAGASASTSPGTSVEPAVDTPTPTSTAVPTTSAAPVATLSYVEDQDSVLAIIRDRDDTTRFTALAAALGSDDVFRQARGVTLLVPVDAAFESLGDDGFEGLLGDQAAVALFLSEHLAVGAQSVADLVERGVFVNAMAQTLPVVEDAGTVSIGGADVVVPDLVAPNGTVHLIDAIIPPAEQ